MWDHLSCFQLFATLWAVACQASLLGGSPEKNIWVYWPILVAISFYSTIFPAALATNSLEYLVLPELLQPKQLHYLHNWSSLGQNPNPPRQPQEHASGANPSGRPTCTGGNKTTIETRAEPKPSHQLYKLKTKSTRFTRQTLSTEYIKGQWELPHTHKNALVLIAVYIGGKNTQE